MNEKEQIKAIAVEVEYVHEQLADDHPIGEILNRLLSKGFSRREAVACVRQAQSELE